MLGMKKMIVGFCCVLMSLVLQAQTAEDRRDVEAAINNYVDAFYRADTLKAYESVVPYLAKRGYAKRDGQYRELHMSFTQLVALAQRWKSGQPDLSTAPRKITIFEVMDQTASAKVDAQWGTDYFHLARLNGKWMIVNVLWQTKP